MCYYIVASFIHVTGFNVLWRAITEFAHGVSQKVGCGSGGDDKWRRGEGAYRYPSPVTVFSSGEGQGVEKATGGRRREGRKRDSKGCGNREKL